LEFARRGTGIGTTAYQMIMVSHLRLKGYGGQAGFSVQVLVGGMGSGFRSSGLGQP